MLQPVRTAEWVNLGTFSFFMVCAWLRPLTRSRRARATALGLGGIVLTLGAYFAQSALPLFALSIVRDWLPFPLMAMVYWQTGQFFSRPNERLQSRFAALDDRILGRLFGRREGAQLGSLAAGCLELAYLSCYVLVPLGLVVLYVLGLRADADEYWLAVLSPTYLCYALLPFVQMLPPRFLPTDPWRNLTGGKVRTFNLVILRLGSTQVDTFPSAHVAAALSAALVLLQLAPVAGMVFLVLAVGVALGAVLGRYHYALDAIAAAALVLAFFVARIV